MCRFRIGLGGRAEKRYGSGSMKDYPSIPIRECREPLVRIPPEAFAFSEPHPYAALGAPYGGASPWLLRRSVLVALADAQGRLTALRPGWTLKLFDAYRPLPVQAFMVWREFQQQARRRGDSLDAFRDPADLARRDPQRYATLAATVFLFWSVPADDPRAPPPHSTGAAIDLTLQDASGQEADMGCPIDETTERAFPDHFADAADAALRAVHARRQLLNEVMSAAGFNRHANEWWHFSLGDQMAACAAKAPFARYGRADNI